MKDTKQTSNLSNLLKQIDIVTLVKNYINLSKKGQNYWGVCPFHNDSSPSMSVSEKKQFFKCFACNHSGNAIKFVMDFKKLNFYEAIKEIEQVLNLDLGLNNLNINEHDIRLFNLMNLAKDTYEGFLQRDENQDKLEYLLNRKISRNQIEKFAIGYAPNEQKKFFDIAINKDDIRGVFLDKSELFNSEDLELAKLINVDKNGDIHDFFKNRIMIPIFDQTNNVVGFSGRAIGDELPKYMNSPTSQLFKKDEILYNINNLDSSNHTCYLVEGFMDLYALDSIGISNSLATMGTAFSDNHIKLLTNNKISDIILCFDNDNAGIEATIKTGEKIGKRLNVFTLKPNQTKHKDFNDVLVNDGNDELFKIVTNTIHFSIYYLEYFLSTTNNSGDVNKQNNYKEAIEIIKKTGNNLYLNDYKKIINNYLGIDFEIISQDLSEINFKKQNTYTKNNSYEYKPKEKNNKENNFIKDLSPQWLLERIIKINHTLFLAAASNRNFSSFINKNYTVIEYPSEMLEMFELVEEYYLENPETTSIIVDKYHFLDWCKNKTKISQNIEILLHTYNPALASSISSIQKNINLNNLNEVLLNLSLIDSTLANAAELSDQKIQELQLKRKKLLDKKIELQTNYKNKNNKNQMDN